MTDVTAVGWCWRNRHILIVVQLPERLGDDTDGVFDVSILVECVTVELPHAEKA